ncbi:MAG: tRNA threonylcarbamoyladenosine dehydratase [Oscillospiraceae bacterium]|nr:tRNA threonylcarbamoyladenosine dehydratase [Oscillospiraceae bacterium]
MDPFSRTRLLLGSYAMEKLNNARVAVFGLGGVGGYVVEALARSGVGALDLIDHDTISPTNINRQILATVDTVGIGKAEAAKQRVLSINPQIKVNAIQKFYGPDTADEFDFSQYDYVVDAIDTVTGKLALVTAAQAAGTPIISSMGTGNKLDPTRFQIADISKTSVCPLARIMRKECAKRGIQHLKVLYSTEDPVPSDPSALTDEELPEGRRALPGSVAFVPSVAGLIIAGEVIKDMTSE